MSIICPYCNKNAILVDSSIVHKESHGLIWLCRECDAYVGVHEGSEMAEPLGTLAKKDLRRWRQKTHRVFDLLWKENDYAIKTMGRDAAYRFLQHISGVESKEKAHIGCFDIATCKRVVNRLAGLAMFLGINAGLNM